MSKQSHTLHPAALAFDQSRCEDAEVFRPVSRQFPVYEQDLHRMLTECMQLNVRTSSSYSPSESELMSIAGISSSSSSSTAMDTTSV